MTATFTLNQYTITASANPPAGGSVSCSPNPVNHGSTSTCTITTNSGYTLQNVGGTCGGTLNGSTYTTNPITSDCTVIANFTLNTYTLSITKGGPGMGLVVSNPTGINCGSDCNETYNHGTAVTLTATPDSGYIFIGWGGDCLSCGLNSDCSINMVLNRSCTASFYYSMERITGDFNGDGIKDTLNRHSSTGAAILRQSTVAGGVTSHIILTEILRLF